MLKKTFLALGLATLMAIPAGVAFADDFPAAVTQTQQRAGDQDQLQVRDPDVCGTCATIDSDRVALAEPTVTQTRVQEQARDRDRDCVLEDAVQAQAREQVREQTHMQDSEQTRAQYGGVEVGSQSDGASGEHGHRNGVDS